MVRNLISQRMYRKSTQGRAPVKTDDPGKQFLQHWRRQTRSQVGCGSCFISEMGWYATGRSPLSLPCFLQSYPLADHSFVIQLIHAALRDISARELKILVSSIPGAVLSGPLPSMKVHSHLCFGGGQIQPRIVLT